MCKRSFSLMLALTVLLCATLCSCKLADFIDMHIGLDMDGEIAEYSADLLKKEFTSAVDGKITEGKITVQSEGLDSDKVQSDSQKILDDDEWLAYNIKNASLSIAYGENAVIKYEIEFNDEALPKSSIIETDGLSKREIIMQIAGKLNNGENTVAIHSEKGFVGDDRQQLMDGASVNAKTAYVFTGYSCKSYPKSGTRRLDVMTFKTISAEKQEKLNFELNAQIERSANNILTNLKSDDKQEICRAIHDFICESVEYDDDILGEGKTDDNTLIRRSAYGAFVYGKTICSGYSLAFLALYDKLVGDGECTVVAGKADNGDYADSHAWNKVTDGGVEYYIDCTFDDGTTDYRYFYKTTDSEEFSSHEEY